MAPAGVSAPRSDRDHAGAGRSGASRPGRRPRWGGCRTPRTTRVQACIARNTAAVTGRKAERYRTAPPPGPRRSPPGGHTAPEERQRLRPPHPGPPFWHRHGTGGKGCAVGRTDDRVSAQAKKPLAPRACERSNTVRFPGPARMTCKPLIGKRMFDNSAASTAPSQSLLAVESRPARIAADSLWAINAVRPPQVSRAKAPGPH